MIRVATLQFVCSLVSRGREHAMILANNETKVDLLNNDAIAQTIVKPRWKRLF
jgi:hypothetical protein